MPLPSQSARNASSGRSPMYRRSRGGSKLIVIGLLAAAGVAVWFLLPKGERDKVIQPGPANAKATTSTTTPAPANRPPAPLVAVEEKKLTPAPIPETPKPAPPPPIVEISQGAGGKPVVRSEPEPAPTASAPAARIPSPAPPTPPAVAQSALDQVASVGAARDKQRAGDLVAARALYSRVLVDGKLMPSEESAVREELAKINDDLVFSAKVTPADPFTTTHKVQGGDSLVKIAQRYKLGPDWRLIQRINRMPDPNRLREGQSLKLIRGPFHAVVQKSQYRLDLYMGPADDESQWLFIRSFTVGLGEGNSTPLGTFVVKKASKLVDPYWVNPRTGERFESSDPKNPIGEFWIGLEGIGEALPHVGYGVHGTIDPESIGKQKSMGCVRLGSEDIALMYELLGEQVSMVRIEP